MRQFLSILPLILAPKSILVFKPILLEKNGRTFSKPKLENRSAFSKKNYPSIPIIIVSALGKEDLTVIEGFKLGVDDFIAKPFNPIELVLRVKRFV